MVDSYNNLLFLIRKICTRNNLICKIHIWYAYIFIDAIRCLDTITHALTLNTPWYPLPVTHHYWHCHWTALQRRTGHYREWCYIPRWNEKFSVNKVDFITWRVPTYSCWSPFVCLGRYNIRNSRLHVHVLISAVTTAREKTCISHDWIKWETGEHPGGELYLPLPFYIIGWFYSKKISPSLNEENLLQSEMNF